MITELRTLPKARVEEINALLQAKEGVVADDPLTDLLDSVSVEFLDGWVADIRVLNSDDGPYLDPILWDDYGNEVLCLDAVSPERITPNRFVFDGKDFEAHEVVLLQGTA